MYEIIQQNGKGLGILLMMFAINKSSRLQRSNNKMVIRYQFLCFLIVYILRKKSLAISYNGFPIGDLFRIRFFL